MIKNERGKLAPGNIERPYNSTYTDIKTKKTYVQTAFPSGKDWVETAAGVSEGIKKRVIIDINDILANGRVEPLLDANPNFAYVLLHAEIIVSVVTGEGSNWTGGLPFRIATRNEGRELFTFTERSVTEDYNLLGGQMYVVSGTPSKSEMRTEFDDGINIELDDTFKAGLHKISLAICYLEQPLI